MILQEEDDVSDSISERGRAEEETPRIDDEYDLTGAMIAVYRQRMLVMIVTGLFAIGSVIVSLRLPEIYQARVTMLPQGQGTQSGLLGRLASFTGDAAMVGSNHEANFAEILRSDRVLDPAIERLWDHEDFERPVSLHDIFDVPHDSTSASSMARADDRLKRILARRVISFHRQQPSGFMVLTVKIARDPQLAAELANLLVGELRDYLSDLHRKKASRQRRFIEQRLEEITVDLKRAEAELESFVANNRAYAASPALSRRFGELSREVQAQTSLWVEMRRQLETAKIDEQRDALNVVVLDPARPETQRVSPRRSVICIVGTLLGFVVALILLFVKSQYSVIRRRMANQ